MNDECHEQTLLGIDQRHHGHHHSNKEPSFNFCSLPIGVILVNCPVYVFLVVSQLWKIAQRFAIVTNIYQFWLCFKYQERKKNLQVQLQYFKELARVYTTKPNTA